MADEVRRPIPSLSPEERKRRLAERGLDENMIPFDATPEEREAAMHNINATNVVAPVDPQPVPTSQPAQGAILNQPVVKGLTVLGVVAAGVAAAAEAGVLPAWAGTVAHGIIAVLAVLGVASPGVRKTA